MAAFETSSVPEGNGRIAALVRRLTGAFVQWNDNRITRKALSDLSEYELEDIGLTPRDAARLGLR